MWTLLLLYFFLDEDIKKVFWRDFDPFGTNKYIEFEKVGNEKTLDDLAKLFNVNPASIIPKDVGLTLGSKDKPLQRYLAVLEPNMLLV